MLYYADYSVLFIDRPTYDEWEGGLLGHAALCGLFGIVYWYAHVWRMGRPFFNILKTKVTVLYGYMKIQLFYFIFALDAGLRARSQYWEGPATGTSTQVFLGFPVSISKCWDGSQDSKLPLHASRVALPT